MALPFPAESWAESGASSPQPEPADGGKPQPPDHPHGWSWAVESMNEGRPGEHPQTDLESVQRMVNRVEKGKGPDWVKESFDVKADALPRAPLHSVDKRTSILDVLAKFQEHRNLRITDFADPDFVPPIWGRGQFLAALLTVKDLSQPIALMSDVVLSVPSVPHDAKLSEILVLMYSSHVDEVVVSGSKKPPGAGANREPGTPGGEVLHLESILAWVHAHHEAQAVSRSSRELVQGMDVRAKLGDVVSKDLMRADTIPGDEDDEGPQTLTKEEHARLGKQGEMRKQLSPFQIAARDWVSSLWTELLIMVLLTLHLAAEGVEIYQLMTSDDREIPGEPRWKPDTSLFDDGHVDSVTAISGVILLVFSFEAAARIYGFQWALVDGSRLFDLFDVVIVVMSIAFYILALTGVTLAQARWVIFARLLRMIKAINIARSLRKLVGSNKRRYQKDGFDLDLTYVTPSCIAMSLPAEGGEANYRNSLVDVCRFFHTKHPEMFYIYNLCAERSYDAAHFSGRVKRFMCDDHNPPLLSDLVSFVEHGNRFMDESDNHVMGVHCLGGKGRTGVFVCAWLMYSTFSASAQAALVHFAAKRTGHGGKTVQGVSGASQRRYLHYFQRVLENGGYRTSRLVLNKIVMITCPKMDPDGGCDPWFTIEQNGVFIYNSKVSLGVTNMKKNTAFIEFEIGGLEVQGDIRVVFYDNDVMPPRDELMFFSWIHTGFVSNEIWEFPKDQVDMACSDKSHKVFDQNFGIQFHFDDVPVEVEFQCQPSDDASVLSRSASVGGTSFPSMSWKQKSISMLFGRQKTQLEPPSPLGRLPSLAWSGGGGSAPLSRRQSASDPSPKHRFSPNAQATSLLSINPSIARIRSAPDTGWVGSPASGEVRAERLGGRWDIGREESPSPPRATRTPSNSWTPTTGDSPSSAVRSYRHRHGSVPSANSPLYPSDSSGVLPQRRGEPDQGFAPEAERERVGATPSPGRNPHQGSTSSPTPPATASRHRLEGGQAGEGEGETVSGRQLGEDGGGVPPARAPSDAPGAERDAEQGGEEGQESNRGGLMARAAKRGWAFARVISGLEDEDEDKDEAEAETEATSDDGLAPDWPEGMAISGPVRREAAPDERAFSRLPSDETNDQQAILLGPWRMIEAATANVQEQARKFRGQKVECDLVGTFSFKPPDIGPRPEEECSLVRLEESLCIATHAPAVSHETVGLYRVSDVSLFSDLPNHKHSRNLMRYYQQGQRGSHQGVGGTVARWVRRAVSMQKIRFQEAGFDLDLTYITPRVIAMGYPATGFEGHFRNSADEVYRFFEERHSGHYRIINLVAEREYDLADMFGGSVARYPFCDHNPPAMELLLPACAHMHAYLQLSPDNTVAVHCKAGKGRTGLIIVCYLLFAGLVRTTRTARRWYDTSRAKDCKGLTIISQIRYAHYFEEQLRRLQSGQDCPTVQSASPALRLIGVVVDAVPKVSRGGCALFVTVGVRSEMDFEELVIFSTKPGQGPHPHTVRGGDAGSARWVRALGAGQFHEDATGGLRVAGDIHITLYHHSQGLNKKKEKVCHFWLHSGFMLNPPAEMGGTLRKISQEQLASLASEAGAHTSDEAAFSHRFHLEKHPGGCFALCLQKHEIDGAAGAKNSSRFADDFSVTLLFEALHETVGTGTALTNAERFARSKGGGFLSGASSQNAELALRTYQDKLEYMMVKQTGTMSRLSSLRAANSPGAWRSSPPSSASTPAAAGCGTAVPRVPSYEAWLTTASRMAAVPLWDMDTIRHTIESLDLEAGRETRAATLRKDRSGRHNFSKANSFSSSFRGGGVSGPSPQGGAALRKTTSLRSSAKSTRARSPTSPKNRGSAALVSRTYSASSKSLGGEASRPRRLSHIAGQRSPDGTEPRTPDEYKWSERWCAPPGENTSTRRPPSTVVEGSQENNSMRFSIQSTSSEERGEDEEVGVAASSNPNVEAIASVGQMPEQDSARVGAAAASLRRLTTVEPAAGGAHAAEATPAQVTEDMRRLEKPGSLFSV